MSTTATSPTVTATEVDGWRLVISEPSPGARIGRTPTICYEITGSAREAVVALDLRLFAPRSDVSVVSTLADASVGRGSVRAPFEGVAPGTYDLEVGLVVDGDAAQHRVVRIPRLRLVADLPSSECGWIS